MVMHPDNIVNVLIDKFIETSKPIKELAKSIVTCVDETKKLMSTIVMLVNTQQVHNQMIAMLFNNQKEIVKKLSEGAIDMSMPLPKLNDDDHVNEDDASKARKLAESKPN